MREIRQLAVNDYDQLVPLLRNAFPGTRFALLDGRGSLKERFIATQQQDGTTEIYGLFEHNRLLGSMKFHHYMMNVHGTLLNVGGIGLVAVGLLHKKEKVGRDLLTYFMRSFREQKTSIALLYPFRVDFYRKMGFGIGTMVDQYRLHPSSFPNGGSKKQIVEVTESDRELVLDCYHRYVERTHGMIVKTELEARLMFADQDQVIVAYKHDGKVEGYLAFGFKRLNPEDNFSPHDLVVNEFIYETPEALSQLCTFLHSQADQIERVVLETQDEYWQHLLLDPTNDCGNILPHAYLASHITGIGAMFRVIDVRQAFADLASHNFGGLSMTVDICIRDQFLPENAGSTIVRFQDGWASVCEGATPDVAIELDIADFSSLLMGAVPFHRLMQYSAVRVSDERYLEQLDRLFYTPRKPVCMTCF